ncbi:MAG: hypothetical protein RR214_03015, partial [Synergistaceae bacterium]
IAISKMYSRHSREISLFIKKLNRGLAKGLLANGRRAIGKRLKEKPRFVTLRSRGSLLDKQEAKTAFFVLCVSLSCLGVIFAKTGGVLAFATVAAKQKPKSTLLPSRRKTSAAHLWVKQPADSHKSQKRRFGSLTASERKAFRTRHNHSDKFRFSTSLYFTRSSFRKVTSAQSAPDLLHIL